MCRNNWRWSWIRWYFISYLHRAKKPTYCLIFSQQKHIMEQGRLSPGIFVNILSLQNKKKSKNHRVAIYIILEFWLLGKKVLLLHLKKSRLTLRETFPWSGVRRDFLHGIHQVTLFLFFHQDKRRIVMYLRLNPLRGSSHRRQRLAHKDFTPQNVHPTPPSPPLPVVRHHSRPAARQHLAVCQRRDSSLHPRSGVYLRISFCQATAGPSQRP